MNGVQDPGLTPGRSTRKCICLLYFLMGLTVDFDWAISKEMDNTVDDDRKSHKSIDANSDLFLAAA